MTLRPRWLPKAALVAIGVVVLAVGMVLVWTAVSGLRAKHDLEQVRTDLNAVKANPPAREELVRRLRTDAAKAKVAHDQMHELGPALAAHIPFLGRSIVAEQTIADAASSVLGSATSAAAATDGLSTGGTGVSLSRLANLHTVLVQGAQATAGPLRRLALLNTGLTPGLVSRSVHQAQDQLGGVSASFDHVAALTDAMGDLLGAHGPRTIYIGLENNAELRGTGGLISTYTLAHAAGGHLTIEPFRDSQGVAKIAEHAVTVPAPADYVASYGGYLANTTLWLNATMDPDVPSTASVISALNQESFGKPADAVLLLDVAGMAKIVSATGPLHLRDGSVLTGDQLIQELLVKEYGNGSLDLAVQDARHARLADAAGTGFAALTSHESDLNVLKALSAAASGRHLALWSSTPAVQAELDRAGVSGSINPQGSDIGLVTVNNLGDSPNYGNKLDFYAQRSLSIHVVVGEKTAEVTETLTMTNHAPSGLGPYVAGPVHPGRMHLLVSLATAPTATVEGFSHAGTPAGFYTRPLSGTHQVTWPADLEQGQTGSWTLQYSVPVSHGHYSLRLLLQPLASPATLTVSVAAADGSHLGTVTGDGTAPWVSSHTLTADLRHLSWWNRKL